MAQFLFLLFILKRLDKALTKDFHDIEGEQRLGSRQRKI
jgi:hypothetical protein